MNGVDWNKNIKEALDRTEFMALATSGPEGPWVCPVVFSYDREMNFYFVSMTTSTHVRNIEKDPSVALAIYKTERVGVSGVIGLQIVGEAATMTDPEELAKCSSCYFNRAENYTEIKEIAADAGGEGSNWQFFKVKTRELWYFNSKDFGEKRIKVELSDLAPNPSD